MILPFVLIISLVILVDLALIILWKNDSCDPKSLKFTPTISILIAARNEEANIKRCLDSLLALDYPANKLQILVGDDQSTDSTYQLAIDILKNDHNSNVVKIESTLAHQRGKANVLAQLAQKASGDYFLITDADMELPQNWAKTMLSSFKPKTGIVTGVTKVSENSNQSIDWLFALGMVKVLHENNVPVTSMGNNMAISREAYEAVGGYESIPFSITEDLELFKQVHKKGFYVKQLYCKNALGISQPVESMLKLLEQRKRWMRGAIQLPWPIVLLLFIQASYFPAQLILLILFPWLAIALLLIKFGIQSAFIAKCIRQLNLETSFIELFKHEIYTWIVSLSATIYFFVPTKVSWKGRKY